MRHDRPLTSSIAATAAGMAATLRRGASTSCTSSRARTCRVGGRHLGGQLAPSEREPREWLVRDQRRNAARVAAAIERGVCGDKTRRHARRAQALHRGFPQSRGRKRIAGRVEHVGRDFLHEGKRVKAREERRHELARADVIASRASRRARACPEAPQPLSVATPCDEGDGARVPAPPRPLSRRRGPR